MQTITVSIDDETYRRTCAKAAEAGTDVQALLSAYLCEYTETPEERFDRLLKHQQLLLETIDAKGPITTPTDRLTRDELHDRDALR